MVMRIAGLGSGMDIDSMVTKLMTAEKAPLDKLKQTDQKLAWKAQAYRDINVKISAFRDSLSTLRFSSSWGKTSSVSSDTTKVDVSSVGTAPAGTHNIVVKSLATGASAISGSTVTSSTSLQGSADLSTGLSISSASNNNKLSVTLNGVTKTVTVAAGTYDKNSLQTAIQSAMDQSFGANQIKADISSGSLKLTPQGDPNFLPQLKVGSAGGNSTLMTSLGLTEGQSFKLDSSATLASQAAKLGGLNLTGDSFTINGQSFTISSTDTLNSVMARVNNSAAGVNMYYDSVTDKISVSSKGTGDTARIDFGTSSIFQKVFKLGSASTPSTTSGTAAMNPSLAGSKDLSSGVTVDSTNNQFNVTLNGTTQLITIADGTYNNASDLQTAIQDAMDAAFTINSINVDLTSGKLELTPADSSQALIISADSGNMTALSTFGLTDGQSNELDTSASLTSQAGKLGADLNGTSFKINGVSFSISAADSLDSIMTAVNNSAAGVTMSYDSATNKVSITGANGVDFTGTPGTPNFQSVFNLNSVAASNNAAIVTQGKNAQVKIDGVDGTYASNKVTSNGVTYTLKAQTDAAGINVNVNQDTDSIYNSITDFVNKYNDLLTSLNTKINEPVFRDFQALTDDQKKAMNETDIANWEAKSKSGLLARDSSLQQLRNSMRQISYSSVSNLPSDMNALYEIGISTSSYTQGDLTNAGKLTIDATKLKDAIARDPQGVVKIFANQTLTDKTSEQGVMQRLYSSSSSTITSIIKTAGSGSEAYDKVTNTLGHQVNDLNVKILEMQDKLTTKENNYYSMFSKMDTAISNSNAQVNWLASFMS